MKRTVVTLAINAALRVIGTMPTCILGNAYSATIRAFGGSGSGFIFDEDPTQSLPSGLVGTDNHDGTYTVAGTTSVPGPVHVFGTLMDDERNGPVPYSFTFLVQPLPLTISGHIAGGLIGAAASGTYTISGGVAPYTVTVNSGTSPCDGNFDNTGAAQGNWQGPSGLHTWNVHVVDSVGTTSDLADSCTNSYATLTLTGTYPTAYTGVAYSEDIAIAGGSGSYSNPRTTSGSIGGLSLSIVNVSGSYKLRLSGTPSSFLASNSVTFAVDSSDGQTATHTQAMQILDSVAISIYNKIANSAGGAGVYFDLHEAQGANRVDQANASFTLSEFASSVATADGPRGSGDVCFDSGGNASSLASASTNNSNVDVHGGGEWCVFGWWYATSTVPTSQFRFLISYGDQNSGTTVAYGMQDFQGTIYGGATNGGSTTFTSGAQSEPSTNAWHFYCHWWQSSDSKQRVAVDNGTPDVASLTNSDVNSVTQPFRIGDDSSGTGAHRFQGRYSRVGVIKGGYLTSTERGWIINSGNGRDWGEIKTMAGH